ncbi:DUF1643 domain-containing protein [bacterium LRH843]|nr:DUF1643 domain-containing protein [bacterium LRH843]
MKKLLLEIIDLGDQCDISEFDEKFEQFLKINKWNLIKEDTNEETTLEKSFGIAEFDTSIAHKHRYSLQKIWDSNKKVLGCVLMNPSNASASESDDTINFLIKYAIHNNYGSIRVVNTSSFIKGSKTRKKDFKLNATAVKKIIETLEIADNVILGWGLNGSKYGVPLLKHNKLRPILSSNLNKLRVFKLNETSSGVYYPSHPLPRKQEDQFKLDSKLKKLTLIQLMKILK